MLYNNLITYEIHSPTPKRTLRSFIDNLLAFVPVKALSAISNLAV
jgi:hypothetical protein